MPNFVVSTIFKGVDKISPALKKIGASTKFLGKTAESSFRRASKSASIFKGVLKGLLVAGALRRAMMGASLAVRGLATEFGEFDKNITKAITRMPGGLDRASSAFKQFGDIARKEAAKTEFTAGQAALGVEQLALAGFNVEQVMAALPSTINLATNAGIELDEATRIATKSLGAFGLKVDDTAQLQTNLTRVNDVFSTAVSSASLNIQDMFEVLKFGGPSANAAGQSIETFAAITGVLADASIDASVAGTSMRSMFINLAAPVPKAKKLLKKLGVEVKDGITGNFRDAFNILQDVAKATKKMGNVQKTATLNTIFGKRAINAMNVILDAGIPKLRDFRENLESSGGRSKKMADTIRTGLNVRLLRLKSALVEVGFKFIEAFGKGNGDLIESLITSVSNFDVQPVIQGLKDVVQVVREVKTGLDVLKPVIISLTALWGLQKLALAAVTVAQWGLNAAMIANPIGIVIVALAVAVGLIWTLANRWAEATAVLNLTGTQIQLGFEQAFLGIKEAFAGVVNFVIGGVNQILQAVSKIPGAGDLLGGFQFEKFEVGAGEKERIAQLNQTLAKAQKEVFKQSILGDIDLLKKANEKIEQIQFKNKREQFKTVAPAQSSDLFAPQLPVSGTPSADAPEIVPPNRSEVEAQRAFAFEGKLTFENAPDGMQFEQTSTGPQIDTDGLGRQ